MKKERKLYLWDWSSVEHDGPRFENLVASQLLKYCHWVEDTEGHAMELRYLRDTDKREVDFVVLKNRKPLFAVECKSGEKTIGGAIRYFAERTPIPHFYPGARPREALLDRQSHRAAVHPVLRRARHAVIRHDGGAHRMRAATLP